MTMRVTPTHRPKTATAAPQGHPVPATTADPVGVVDNPDTVTTVNDPARQPASPRAVALRNFLQSIQPEVDALAPQLLGSDARVGAVRTDRVAAAPMLANLLSNRPELAPGNHPEEIQRAVDELNTAHLVVSALTALASRVEETARLAFDDGWTVAMTVYRTAERRGRRDKTLAAAVAPVQDLFRLGARLEATTRKAQDAQARAVAAQQRAEAARQQAAMATTAAVHAVVVHNARHPNRAALQVLVSPPQAPAPSPAPPPAPVTPPAAR